MFSTTVSILLLICLALPAAAQEPDPTLPQERLRAERQRISDNRINVCRVYSLPEPDAPAGQGVLTEEHSYGRDGFLRHSSYFDGDTTTITYFYNENGWMTGKLMNGYDVIPIEVDFRYDDNGHLVEQTVSGAEPRIYSFRYEDDHLVERHGKTSHYDAELDSILWAPIERTVFRYDGRGNRIEEIFYMWDEEQIRTDYGYDDRGRLIRTHYRGYGPEGIITRSYDSHGNPLSECTAAPDEEPEECIRFVYQYYP